MRYTAIFIALCLCFHIGAQDKIEREDRIDSGQVPAKARSWLQDAFENTGKVKWYFEQTSGKESYEAKFKHRKRRYSVEFDVSGDIEDVEFERDLDQLPPEHQRSLKDAFSSLNKFRLHRLQEQWSGSPGDLRAAIAGGEVNAITTRYEAEFVAEMHGESAFWEGTFTLDGELIDYRKVILRPTDNLGF